MMLSGLILGILLQRQMIDPVRSTEVAQRVLASQVKAFDDEAKKSALAEQKLFVDRFEALALAMENFSKAYNAGKGEVWPSKEAGALARAIRNFETARTWKLSAKDRGSR